MFDLKKKKYNFCLSQRVLVTYLAYWEKYKKINDI